MLILSESINNISANIIRVRECQQYQSQWVSIILELESVNNITVFFKLVYIFSRIFANDIYYN